MCWKQSQHKRSGWQVEVCVLPVQQVVDWREEDQWAAEDVERLNAA